MKWLRWPKTLASQLSLIFLVSLLLANGLSFSVQFYERYLSARSTMLNNMENDISTSVAILDRLPAEERQAWLSRLNREHYQYLLTKGDSGVPMDTADPPMSASSIKDTLGQHYALTFADIPGVRPHYQVFLQLADGNPVTIDVRPADIPVALWLPVVLVLQLALLLGCTWMAVRLAIRPLSRLSRAVESLDPNARIQHLDESGPTEVAHAAVAFNAMQQRIADYLKERMQILAAISHDLQTPITRMKLRAEFMDDSIERDKLLSDLGEMEHLVREGVAYARSVHGSTEANCKLDLDAFVDSIVFDYQDVGKAVNRSGSYGSPIETRPHALRRVLINLLDNALKFSGAAELVVSAEANGNVSIKVLDRGPGISAEELREVLKPFYRVESSRNRDTGGTGLGLAIAQQLAIALGGSLSLSNRQGGGLCAELLLPKSSH
ncbi:MULTISPECIES: HAMP domain-containing sensor histidine kinase [unclassified Pseudomonas]|uniref:sensor histidine kinase n=1 Tax=unclassified Pseudomonas TaxID=196821 RepID=UPI001297D452|nr:MULTISPECIES: HAMP domain-containing sensor histidine kinase [unclassified Pseudomonas]MQT41607.1 HAMP domain-containing protein [Pseudomonas sp. FSL R10-0765]MQT52790.1 HAMP domain-containing protein [Pseudomonas sp. FSL R10-2398]MQU01237.1 HAMP domain-containing protein [Pseudomonas sp. FSL R10-2245]MQU11852.1 HAMP domain-containing protein [Pseudomonas sp. FSL R10-2189]MQU38831.1 HAMP domain-containing protein [Pseudomonas sp. FSL R10-2172]